MIDDSALFHAVAYDPVKAREYYLRTRTLKGRQSASKIVTSPSRSSRQVGASDPSGGKPNRADTKSRRAELLAQKAALEKRLDLLRETLQKLVEAAKGRSGVKKPENNSKDQAPETKVDKADRNKAAKDQTPLTAKQKTDKAQKAKKAYEKEHPNTLSTDVDILKSQVQDIQAKIQKAVADARERRNKVGNIADLVRPQAKNNPNDGPRGR